MYHEQTTERIRARRRRWIVLALVVVILVAALSTGFYFFRRNAREQGAAALRNTMLETANRCCAVEGSYPSSLSYLEKNYGLVVNRSDYVVTYESYAGNVVPTVVVVAR
jgi:flagellar basal body-associated protein FliL